MSGGKCFVTSFFFSSRFFSFFSLLLYWNSLHIFFFPFLCSFSFHFSGLLFQIHVPPLFQQSLASASFLYCCHMPCKFHFHLSARFHYLTYYCRPLFLLSLKTEHLCHLFHKNSAECFSMQWSFLIYVYSVHFDFSYTNLSL